MQQTDRKGGDKIKSTYIISIFSLVFLVCGLISTIANDYKTACSCYLMAVIFSAIKETIYLEQIIALKKECEKNERHN